MAYEMVTDMLGISVQEFCSASSNTRAANGRPESKEQNVIHITLDSFNNRAGTEFSNAQRKTFNL